MKKTIKTATITIAVLLVIATVLTAGFLLLKKSPLLSGTSGTLILSVNPEIRIDYDKSGSVTAVKGNNADGKRLLAGIDDLSGKSYVEAVKLLVKEIYNAGYFTSGVESERRNIVVRIEPGSVIPERNFVATIENEIASTVKGLDVKPDVITIGHDDYDNKYASAIRPSQYISLEKAKEIALAHAGVSESEVVFDDREFDFERGRAVYELEFYANGNEYDYDIDATDGKILDYEWDIRKNTSKKDDTVKNGDKPKENASSPAVVEPLDNVTEPTAPTEPTTPTEPPASVEPPPAPTYITLEKAKEIALKDAGVDATKAIFDDREFDFENGRAIYELEFYVDRVEYEYDIDAVNGSILRKKIDDKKQSANNTPSAPTAPSTPSESKPESYITLEKAKEIALDHAGLKASEVFFDDCEFDVEKGKAVYEIDFESGRYEYEYDIDAVSGEVIKSERDYDD